MEVLGCVGRVRECRMDWVRVWGELGAEVVVDWASSALRRGVSGSGGAEGPIIGPRGGALGGGGGGGMSCDCADGGCACVAVDVVEDGIGVGMLEGASLAFARCEQSPGIC